MYNYIAQGEKISYNVVELTADKRDDIETLPTNYAPGSTCFVIEDSSVWMLNSEETWVEL